MKKMVTMLMKLLASLAVVFTGAGVFAQDVTTRPADETTGVGIPINVGFLTLEGVYNSELMAPWDIFHHTVFHTKPGMRVFTVGREKATVTTFEGLRLDVEYALDDAPRIDVLVVPSAVHNMDTDLQDDRLIEWVGERGRQARYVMSVCDGAFILAAAGLLDGRRCTTFPGDIAALSERYTGLKVAEGVSFVADGNVITGAGGALSYDPALYLVETIYGKKVARGVGRGMALDWDLEKIRHLAIGPGDRPTCYLPGDRVSRSVLVETADGRSVRLADIIGARRGVRAVVLTILAGGEALDEAKRGGFWCEDTYAEIANLRYLRLRYESMGVLFVGVLCPPVHHEALFGYTPGAFAREPDNDPVYLANRERFVEASLKLAERDALPFDLVLFDPRFRLLSGRFKWFRDTQVYGTPTTWVLTPRLDVTGPPFFMNVYESDGRKLRYAADDIAALIDRVLGP